MPQITTVHYSAYANEKPRWANYIIPGMIITLLTGMLRNGGRKYIQLSRDSMPLQSCMKVYANVYASSQTETDALVCCDDSNITRWWNILSYKELLCSQQIKPLPLMKSTTRLPYLLIVTFAPVLLRLLIHLCGWITLAHSTHKDRARTAMNRFILYIVIMLFRFYVLYGCFSLTQDFLNNLSSQQPIENCWYGEFLMKRNAASSCYGQRFDFSDHVVLFFAQSLPILIFEATVHRHFALWPSHTSDNTSENIAPTPKKKMESILSYILNTLIASCLSLFFLYLNFITLLTAHSTASYFHTVTESIVGYFISLIVQVPLAFLIWSMKWPRLRDLFGLPSDKKISDLDLSVARYHSD